ncbi:MAG: hypothetical protein V1802_01670 [Candidatus Aenigmatarchaeota archaeon]
MAQEKKLAIYDFNPIQRGVTHVAIQTKENPNRVSKVYFVGDTMPNVPPEGYIVIPLGTALCEYEFEPRNVKNLIQPHHGEHIEKNTLTIEIKSPVDVVFEYTINPDNTPKWIPSIIEEKTSEKPVKVGTIYSQKVRSGSKVTKSKLVVTGFMKNRRLDFHQVNGSYSCSYLYKPIEYGIRIHSCSGLYEPAQCGTRIIYSEENGVGGKLESPMKMETVETLKRLIEDSFVL